MRNDLIWISYKPKIPLKIKHIVSSVAGFFSTMESDKLHLSEHWKKSPPVPLYPFQILFCFSLTDMVWCCCMDHTVNYMNENLLVALWFLILCLTTLILCLITLSMSIGLMNGCTAYSPKGFVVWKKCIMDIMKIFSYRKLCMYTTSSIYCMYAYNNVWTCEAEASKLVGTTSECVKSH